MEKALYLVATLVGIAGIFAVLAAMAQSSAYGGFGLGLFVPGGSLIVSALILGAFGRIVELLSEIAKSMAKIAETGKVEG